MQQDDLEAILQEIEAADAIVFGSPVNYWNVTANFRKFLERLLGFLYWPWGQNATTLRSKRQPRKAVLVASSAIPGFLIPLTTGAAKALRIAAKSLGAKTVGTLWIGLVAREPHPHLSTHTLNRARRMGWKLA
jgi:FMN-dependent NADH-azoreductase